MVRTNEKILEGDVMILITVVSKGYTDTTLLGPFSSVEEGKRKVTDCIERGIDGDETRYTFQ